MSKTAERLKRSIDDQLDEAFRHGYLSGLEAGRRQMLDAIGRDVPVIDALTELDKARMDSALKHARRLWEER